MMLPFLNKRESITLGNKRVETPKLTRNKLKQLTDHMGTIGDYLVRLFLTPQEDRATFIVAAADIAIDEIYEITAILSGLPEDYLSEHAGIGECAEYLRLTWEKNDMGQALGNLQSLLPPIAEQFITSMIKRLEKGEQSL